ncbi:hypothetical protein D5S18_30465 [Nocardia panacis]|uniref:SWIM-type domain-containing protein n=1 Tax=Nocardia panacis TaxID=2340916 RepID=A0A3A4KJU5_9NOCA|nr:hypothetical protein [Nocardia panacis]RJO69478.1 hypothetical protein D5S18_30465 [Nocardia panacis]
MADNEFGYTAWGMDWVRLAEPLRVVRPDPLLPRARSIARNGGVRVEISGRIVRAAIHRGGRASVTHLEVAPLPRGAVTDLATLVADATTLTDEAHRAAVAAGRSPAPELAGIDCSCSARTQRCLHVLAVLYEMARQVDLDPRLALSVQGYFEAAHDDPQAPAQTPRWVPINSLNPADYFA